MVSTEEELLLAGPPRLRERFTVDGAQYSTREALEEIRGERGLAWQGPGIWSIGRLEAAAAPSVAIVGTRAATPYGRRLAREFATELARAGCCIVSGLALGIDAAAHEGALEAGGTTIGVLGGGHARFFPRRNRPLAERIVAGGGAVLSLWPPEHDAAPWQFLERNALVAALADALVVIEAPARSGALNTAGWASHRIPVLAVPGDVDRAHVAGCHALIRDGAILARSAADVLEVLQIPDRSLAEIAATRPGFEGELLRECAQGERLLDELVAATSRTSADVLATLAMLEFEGLVERRGSTWTHATSAHRR